MGDVLKEDIPTTGIPEGIWAAYKNSVIYTGTAITPEVRVYDGKVRLTEGIDYSIKYVDNVNAGTARILIQGEGTYDFEKQYIFTIVGVDIEEVSVKLEAGSYAYTGKEIFPKIIVNYAGVKLVEGKDYLTSYINNIHIGTGTIIIEGIGRYTGTRSIAFKIKEKEIEPEISIPDKMTIKVDENVEIPISITPKDATIEIEFKSDNESVATVNLDRYVVTGHQEGTAIISAQYDGKVEYCTVKVTESTIQSDVLQEDIPSDGIIPNGIWVAGIEDKIYTGSAIEQTFRVYDGEMLLQNGKDYTISYKNSKKAYIINNKEKLSKTDISKAPQIIISMKGLYTGKKILYYNIKPADISTVSVSDISASYNNKGQKPVPTVTWNGIKLKNKADFNIEYRNEAGNVLSKCTEPGTYSIIIHGKGNFDANTKKEISFVIADNSLGKVPVSKLTVSVDKATTTYKGGNSVIPTITVKNGQYILEPDKDYKVEFTNNTEVGIGYLTITGIGKYVGTRIDKFVIVGSSISKYKATNVSNVVYNGTAQEQSDYMLKVKNNSTVPLTENKEYTVSYLNNTNVGTATMIFTGTNGYEGTLKKTFKIIPLNLNVALKNDLNSIMIDQYDVSTGVSTIVAEYKKDGAKPIPVIYYRDASGASRLLRESVDYKVTYKNNKQVYIMKSDETGFNSKKAPTIVITGIGNFTGKISIPFIIQKQNISDDTDRSITVSVADMKYVHKKNNFKQKVKVLDSEGKVLIQNKDYALRYLDENGRAINNNTIMPIGSVITVEIVACENSMYLGTIKETFQLKGEIRNIENVSFKISKKEYTGKEVELVENDFVTATFGKGKNKVIVPLIVAKNTDNTYTTASGIKTDGGFEIVGYSNNIRKGTAYVTIQGVGTYSGTRVLTYNIGARSIGTFWNGLYNSIISHI